MINCPWGESNWEFGPYSPQTLKATSWVGAVVGGAPSSLYFEWNGPTPNDLPDEQLTAAAALVGLEMGTLTASLAAPVDGSVPQPTVSVRSTSTTPDVAPPATPAGYVRAAAYREPPAPGVSDCVHVVAVNAKPSTAKVDFFVSGATGHANASQPLLWDVQDRHPEQTVVAVSQIDDEVSVFSSYLGPTSTAIYRLGCEVETRAGNLLPNPVRARRSFPLSSAPGGSDECCCCSRLRTWKRPQRREMSTDGVSRITTTRAILAPRWAWTTVGRGTGAWRSG